MINALWLIAIVPVCVLSGYVLCALLTINGSTDMKSEKKYIICAKHLYKEAYKECLTKVKNYIKTHCNPYSKPDFDYDTSIKILNFINNLLKEMVGEEK